MTRAPNQPGAVKGGIAPRFQREHHWLAVTDPGRSAAAHTGQIRHFMKKAPNGQFLSGALALSLAALFTGCPSKPTPIAAELQSLQGTWKGAVVGDKSDNRITITITRNSFYFH